VGPGTAYEKWKKTIDYHKWYEVNDLLMDSATPFVVFTEEGRAERRFAMLAEAVAAAASGDTIEIRGNGPFVVRPIDLGTKALTLRGGTRFSPVLKLAAEAVQADLPLLTTRAALVLEGLEF